MYQYRITKYDPAFRVDGKYTKEEWTSMYDIGKVYDGKVFTQEEYEKTEQNHIDCLIALLDLSGVNSLRIQKLEADKKTSWRENQVVDLSQVPLLIRDCLREKCWCQLYHENAYIHFGYDYYVYFGSDVPYEQCVEICCKYGLFCEEIMSPYSDPIPEIYCALKLSFNKNTDLAPILHALRKLGIADPKPHEPKYGNIHGTTVAEIYYEPYWELEDALNVLFGQVDGKLQAIKQIVDVFKGDVLLDIAFYQYGTYPALVFDKENMKKIRFLEADISIDPYGPFDDDEDDKKERTEEI